MTIGHVREYDRDLGFGVIDSAATPGGCFVHYSAIRVPGFAALAAGDAVEFRFEEFPQDGYAYRATEAYPAGASAAIQEIDQSGQAYGSTLTFFKD